MFIFYLLMQTVRLLRNLWIDIQAENGKGSTALQILRARENSSDQVRECVNILGQPCVLQFVQKIPWYLIKLLSQWGYEIKNISNETGNVLLVVTVLILTATYTATLSPPVVFLSLIPVPTARNSRVWKFSLVPITPVM